MSDDPVHQEQVRRLVDVISEAEQKTDFMHPWMYSFLPATVEDKQEMFLLAFCKNCRQAATILLGHSHFLGKTTLTETDLPKWGCVPPQSL